MEELLRTIFEAFPEKSKITFEGKCSDCGKAVTIDIFPTLEGFGLLGGAFVEYPTDRYVSKCPDCYKIDFKMIEQFKENQGVVPIFGKKDLLSSLLSTQKGRET